MGERLVSVRQNRSNKQEREIGFRPEGSKSDVVFPFGGPNQELPKIDLAMDVDRELFLLSEENRRGG
jgi:hypothetical protein